MHNKIICFIFCLVITSASYAQENGTIIDLTKALEPHTSVLTLGDKSGKQLIIVPGLGGRVLGISIAGEHDRNLIYVNKSVLDGSYWEKKPLNWNSGGLRTWLSPESLINAKGINPDLDPQPYTVTKSNANEVSMTADLTLPLADGITYAVTIEQQIRLIEDLPARYGNLPAGIEYIGIDKIHTLTNHSAETIGIDIPYVCLWSSFQTTPGGVFYVPLRTGDADKSSFNYFFQPFEEHQHIDGDLLWLDTQKDRNGKIGVPGPIATPRSAYLKELGDGVGILYFQMSPVDPDGIYVNKFGEKTATDGGVVEIFGGTGFDEIECHGPARKVMKGETMTHSFEYHMFRGPVSDLMSIGSAILKTDICHTRAQ